MKKLMFLMMALLVAPAMAAVTISLEPVGECSVDIVVTADGADTVDGADVYSLVAGVALNVSVSPGQIDSVTGYMTAGVSTAADPGCGIYMGTITFTGGEPEAILDVGTPVAPNTAPDAPGIIPGPACVLEAGCLFDVGVPADASLARTVLCTLNLSETTTVTVTEEIATRGGIVLIGGGAPSSTVLPPPTLVDCAAPPECMKDTHPAHTRWGVVEKPDCWCYEYQYAGDINGELLYDWYPVSGDDLTLFVDAYMDGPSDLPVGGICADLDHALLYDWYAVSGDDLTIFTENYMDGYSDIPANPNAADFNFYTTP